MYRAIALLSPAGLVLALLMSLAPAAQAETKPKTDDLVTLRSSAVVEGDVVRLGDLFDGIADAELADTPVARSPEPGATIEVGARWLAAVAAAHGLSWQPRSRYEQIALHRDSHDIASDDIEIALRSALAEQGIDGDVRLALDTPGLRLRLPTTSERSLRIAHLTVDPATGRFQALVQAPAHGEAQASLSVTGRAVEMTEVPVLKHNVKSGEVIGPHDIEWISVQANRITHTTLVDADSMIGMTPRRTIRAQDLVRSTDLETPVVVARNSLVTIRLQTARMELTAQGRALEDGAHGEVVRVMNTKSNKVVNATVVDATTVVVMPATVTAER